MTIVDYILSQPEPASSIMAYFHDYFLSTYPNIPVTMKYDVPFYVGNHWICYLNPIKKGGVELCFTRGIELSNADGILQAKGRKQVRGIHITSIESSPMEAIKNTIAEAVQLDHESPYRHPKHRKN